MHSPTGTRVQSVSNWIAMIGHRTVADKEVGPYKPPVSWFVAKRPFAPLSARPSRVGHSREDGSGGPGAVQSELHLRRSEETQKEGASDVTRLVTESGTFHPTKTGHRYPALTQDVRVWNGRPRTMRGTEVSNRTWVDLQPRGPRKLGRRVSVAQGSW